MTYTIADANSYEILQSGLPSQAYVATALLTLGRYQVSRVVLNGIIYVLTLASATAQPYVVQS
jgi:hypothetical protein